MTTPLEFQVRRLVVALEGDADSFTALPAAAALAARWQRDLHLVFVEDSELLALAELPFISQVSLTTAIRQRLHAHELLRELQALAARSQRQLATAAAQAGVAFSFEVARGVLRDVATRTAHRDDLIVLLEGRRPFTPHLRRGLLARVFESTFDRSVLVLRQDNTLPTRLLVLADGTPASERALLGAARVAQIISAEIVLLSLHGDGALERRARELLAGITIPVRYETAPAFDLGRLSRLIADAPATALVLAQDSLTQLDPALRQWLPRLKCSFLLVR